MSLGRLARQPDFPPLPQYHTSITLIFPKGESKPAPLRRSIAYTCHTSVNGSFYAVGSYEEGKKYAICNPVSLET